MSGYIHTIGFKILVDSEVIDFTFRVPRGTLLIQVLDELETTLKVEPRIVATVNPAGEILVIENHYSPIDYLIQKHGTEYYVGGYNIVTFNHREYVIDLEVPEAIPFASTFKTACKSFSVNTREAAIERQNGQVMDFEVYSMPTAFVLNSWGNFYRIVDKDSGDPLVDPPKAIGFDSKSVVSTPRDFIPITDMVYPPKLDDDSEIDQLTDHFVDSSYRDKKTQVKDIYYSSEQEEEEAEESGSSYPWKRKEETKPIISEDLVSKEIDKSTIDSLLDEMIISDDDEEEFLTQPITDELPKEDQIITDVEIYDEKPKDEILSDVLVFEEEEEKEDEISSDELDKDLDIFAQDFEVTTEPEFEADEIEEEEEDILDFEQSISDLPPVRDSYIEREEKQEMYIPDIELRQEESQEEEIAEKPTLMEQYPPFLSSTEASEVESTEVYEPQALEELTDELVIETEEPTIEEDVRLIQEIEHLEQSFDELPMDQRLERRKKELEALEAVIKEEEKQKIQQRTVHIEFFEKMNPRKIFPMIVKIPSLKNNNNSHQNDDVLRITPVFPGCYVTPHEEFIQLKSEQEEIAEFNITPLISQGVIHGKVGVTYKGRSLININTIAKIRNFVGVTITSILAFLFGILPFVLKIFGIEVNTALANGFNNTFSTTLSASIFMWIEITLLVILFGLMIGFIFIGKPSKKIITRKFYPINGNEIKK